MTEARAQAQSRTQMTEYVLPQHTNALGGVFGGQIMAWVDLCAAICAQRHAGRMAVTAFVDDLKFEMERGGKFEKKMMPEKIVDLNKKTMRIRGYILPTSVFQQSGIKQFVLVRDNQECCFGPGAMLYDCIIIEMDGNKTIDFSTRPISVRGGRDTSTVVHL